MIGVAFSRSTVDTKAPQATAPVVVKVALNTPVDIPQLTFVGDFSDTTVKTTLEGQRVTPVCVMQPCPC